MTAGFSCIICDPMTAAKQLGQFQGPCQKGDINVQLS